MEPVEKVTVPPLAAVKVALLFNTTLPVKLEEAAALPPNVITPVLPDCTVTARPTVKAPPIKSEASLLPAVSPTSTADDALPSAPALPDGALAPTTKVPAFTVVVPA